METADLFQEDASLPFDYWHAHARKRRLGPEERLLLAVLDNAIRCYRAYRSAGGRRFSEVEHWLFFDHNEDLFSFKNICDVLGLSRQRIREALRGWKATTKQEAGPEKTTRNDRGVLGPNISTDEKKDASRENGHRSVVVRADFLTPGNRPLNASVRKRSLNSGRRAQRSRGDTKCPTWR